jgi:hypothetical protein
VTIPDSMDLEERAADAGSSGGSGLVRFLYPAPAERKVGKIIRWWEKRRLAYNVVVAGCVTGTAFLGLLTLNPPSEVLLALLAPGLPFLVMANVCYTLGWMVESLLHKIWGRSLLPVGPALFRAGLTLAVGVAFVIPTIILMIAFVVRLVTGNL